MRPFVIVCSCALLAALMIPRDANGDTLSTIVRFSTINNFTSGSTDGGCSDAVGPAIPAHKALAISDIRCTATLGLVPPPNTEMFWVGLVDGSGCSGGSVYDATFASVEGLRDSPTLPRVVVTQLSVRALRTASLNPGSLVQVICDFTGTFKPARSPRRP